MLFRSQLSASHQRFLTTQPSLRHTCISPEHQHLQNCRGGAGCREVASQSGQRQGTMATLGTGTPRRTPPQSRSSGQSQAARGRGLGFHTQDSWSHLLWKLQGTRPPVYPPGPGAPGGFSTAAHQAAASPSSPATCQLSLGAVPEAETASLRSGEAEMRISTQQGLSGGSY